MAAHIESLVIDQALNYLNANAARIDLCSSEPTTYTEATSTFTKANATAGAGFTAPLIGTPTGTNPRSVATAVISGAAVTGTATCTWAAISKPTATTALLVVLTMTSQALTSGNTWGASSVTISIPLS